MPGRPLSGEPRATCSDCVMCRKLEPETPSDSYFKPGVKCCGFQPTIPNFLAGAILLDASPEFSRGKEQFERAAERAVVTPLGISAPPHYNWIHDIKAFGRSELLLCPYYRDEQGGQCSIWQHRNARCATWFCKFERGRAGFELWQSMERLLTAVEEFMARHCALRLETQPDQDAATDEAWGPWAGRAREFYMECHRLVAALSWEQVAALGGERVAVAVSAVADAVRILDHPVEPSKLRAGDYRTEPLGEGRLRVWGYSKYDPVDLSAEEATALALAAQNPGGEITFPRQLLRKLLDMKILVNF